jgi:hypothetical protein
MLARYEEPGSSTLLSPRLSMCCNHLKLLQPAAVISGSARPGEPPRLAVCVQAVPLADPRRAASSKTSRSRARTCRSQRQVMFNRTRTRG